MAAACQWVPFGSSGGQPAGRNPEHAKRYVRLEDFFAGDAGRHAAALIFI